MVNSACQPGDWRVNVRFADKGVLRANAQGVLLVPPHNALALVTDPAGDSIFKVVERQQLPAAADGSQRVTVVNKAAIRVLGWKLWTSNKLVYHIMPYTTQQAASQAGHCKPDGCHANNQGADAETSIKSCAAKDKVPSAASVLFQLTSSNMLNSLSGTWRFEPIKVHHASLPPAYKQYADITHSSSCICLARLGSISSSSSVLQTVKHCCSCYGKQKPVSTGLHIDSDGTIQATLLQYEQLAQPKGMPSGICLVPGLSDAVRMSIGREVKQMLDKVHYASLTALQKKLKPQEALTDVCHQLQQAGGSFKKLQKQLAASSKTLLNSVH